MGLNVFLAFKGRSGDEVHRNEVSDEDFETGCPTIIANYYGLLCKISETGAATQQDIAELDRLGEQFQASESLFYNNDVVQARSAAQERRTPDWYKEDLKRIKGQFETDKIYREYRYIANTDIKTSMSLVHCMSQL